MGHLNVGFYVAKSMEALAGLAAQLGMPGAFAASAEATLVVREQHIRFIKEARPGAPLTVSGGVIAMGESDARLMLLMRHHTGDLAASFQMLVSHATARDGRAFPWPDRIRARAEALTAEVPDNAAPRSIGLAPIETQASLARADALGLSRTGLRVMDAQDCDAFGRMRTEMFMHRLSDGIPHFFVGRRPGAIDTSRKVGGAALEYRLIHHAWPRPGDRLELRSGSAGGDPRFRRLVHWLLDPDTGRPWGSAEAIAVSFDLETRKLITLSDEEFARVEADAVPGLGL
ncbi:MAG: thioesterase family protein [Alphaproteobacteria bacterium]|nr:thioesterase family protein [Alphaproteobacteria bacterium]MBU1514211.1 thioesterase family protein [Alphaproteobacteria bacterium]MBU2095889.1 thioesterase family protein [Alphaproteobacteria bacterium]MBU2151627.1 thioesterase family protein [Alphaproteobacteria bacterium]MBU2307125.1 thioesterase family protein [Alphaproteobacteria bacterium]